MTNPEEDDSTTEATTSSKLKSVAEDVLTMVKGAKQLQDGVREAEEVKDVLLEPPAAEEADEKEEKKKVSHFQAMALMGKLFFGLSVRKTKPEGAISEEAEETSDDEEEEVEDDEDEDGEGTETESDRDRGSGESGGGHVTKTQVQVVIEKEDSSRERSPPMTSSQSPTAAPMTSLSPTQTAAGGGVKTISHFQAVTLLTRLFAKVRAQHNEVIAKGAMADAGRSSSSEWTEPLSASDPSTQTGASSSSSRYVVFVKDSRIPRLAGGAGYSLEHKLRSYSLHR